jgi:ATP-binding cassette subfamily C protein
LFTFLLKAFLSIRIIKATAHFVATIEARAALVIATRVFGLGLDQARLNSREETSFAIQSGSPAAFNGLLNAASTLIAEGSLFLLISLSFLTIDPWATFSAIIYFCTIGLAIHYFIGTLLQRAGTQATESTIRANTAIGDLIAVFRELIVLGRRETYIDKIYKSRVSAAESVANQIYLNGMPRYIIETALLVGVAAFILSQALTGDLVSAAGALGVFLAGGFRLTAAMLPLQSALLSIKALLPIARKAHEILAGPPSGFDNPSDWFAASNNSTDLPAESPLGVDFKDVSFSYSSSSNLTLKNLSFEITAGQQVAFIGPSGAGKSTIADLICGILAPTHGVITLSAGKNKVEIGNNHLVSYVPQKPGLVSGTIAENVALGVNFQNLDEDGVWNAIERAHLGTVVRSLPDGIHASLGNYQDSLSGGQIQRLGLARALYSKPGLLVMDEATSALDAESEAEVAKALDEMRGEVTVVLIAHRLNTVQRADQVLLINEGRIASTGTFQMLRKHNPSIERLVQLMKVDED